MRRVWRVSVQAALDWSLYKESLRQALCDQAIGALNLHEEEGELQIAVTNANNSSQEQELSDWLDAIATAVASGTCRDSVLDHLKKHISEPVSEIAACKNIHEWMASLINLVEIAKRVFASHPTPTMQLERLQTKFDKEGTQNGYTPNPRLQETAAEKAGPEFVVTFMPALDGE